MNQNLLKNLIAIVAAIGLLVMFSWMHRQANPVGSSSASSNDETECRKAAGSIWTGVTLYADSQCIEVLGTVYGIGDIPDEGRGVVIDYPDGSRDWKLRSPVIQGTYVMPDDPAIEQKLTRRLNYP